jgi:parvulin-like peptidyl-prolyl isomerase
MKIPLLLAVVLAADPPADPTVAATVNGEVIRFDEVDALIRRRPVVDAPLTAAQTRDLRRAVVDDLIDDKLLSKFLDDHGPKFDQAETDRHLAALAAALKKQGKTVAGFAAEVGLTEARFRQATLDRLRFQKFLDGRATDDELRKYFADHKDEFDRSTVTASHIVARVTRAAPPGEWAAARQRLAAVRADVVAGKVTFADAAKKYSVDPSAARGGWVGPVSRRDSVMDEAFCRAAFALPVGAVSQPVDGEFGVHLILVSDRSEGSAKRYEDVADEVRDCYTEDVRANLVAQLRKAASVQVNVP